jgi:phosphohistidine phosphatase
MAVPERRGRLSTRAGALLSTNVRYRLVLLRHAKAESGLIDESRALAPKGVKQAAQLAKSFADFGVTPDYALVSSATRARQTWEGAIGGKPKIKCPWDVLDALYGASVADVLEILRVVSPRLATVVVVGHEPTMAACASYLAGPGSDAVAVAQAKVGVPTAAWSLLESDEPWGEWGRGAARLVTIRRPLER